MAHSQCVLVSFEQNEQRQSHFTYDFLNFWMVVIVTKNKLLKLQASENIIYFNQNTSIYVLQLISGLNFSFSKLPNTFSDQLICSFFLTF